MFAIRLLSRAAPGVWFRRCEFGFWFCTIQETIRSQTPAQPQHYHTSEAQAGHSEFFFLWKDWIQAKSEISSTINQSIEKYNGFYCLGSQCKLLHDLELEIMSHFFISQGKLESGPEMSKTSTISVLARGYLRTQGAFAGGEVGDLAGWASGLWLLQT